VFDGFADGIWVGGDVDVEVGVAVGGDVEVCVGAVGVDVEVDVGIGMTAQDEIKLISEKGRGGSDSCDGLRSEKNADMVDDKPSFSAQSMLFWSFTAKSIQSSRRSQKNLSGREFNPLDPLGPNKK